MSVAEIDVDELAERLAAGGRLIDVREPDEYAEARIPGAELVPLGTVPQRLDVFRGGEPPLVVCRVGGRSLHACEYLATQGIEAVNVAGGVLAWIASGRGLATGAS